MKLESQFTILGAFFVLSLFLSNCDNVSSPANGEGKNDLNIPMESQHYDLTDNTTDAIIEVKFINKSGGNVYYLAPSFFVTLQQMDDEEWKDQGPWYFIAAGGQRVHTLAPGDTLDTIDLDLRDVVANWDLIRSSSLYRIHFKIYEDEDLEELIPVTDRVSDPFTVIL